MSSNSRRIDILILSEDSGDECLEVWKILVLKMLYLVEPLLDPSAISWAPEAARARVLTAYNGWKSTKSHERHKRVDLARLISAGLRRQRGYVVLHVDGDCRWRESSGGLGSSNLQAFRKLLQPLICDQLRSSSGSAGKTEEPLLTKLFLMIPYYSLEAWLYQNTSEVQHILKEGGRTCRQALQDYREYVEDPSLIEELECPKDDKEVRLKLGARYNLRLAQSNFPAKRMYEARKSFHRAVTHLESCALLIADLASVRR